MQDFEMLAECSDWLTAFLGNLVPWHRRSCMHFICCRLLHEHRCCYGLL